ncbi:MAG TPA: hypothetical protein VN231_09005 [Allosphingosinicella sp.]|nr:hypothetical protein [Allosphingosinicella sp.]
MEPEPAFVMGMMFGALLLWFVQSMLRSRRRRRQADPASAGVGTERGRLREIEELHERLAVLERIATDPAQRTASEIEKLR